MAMGGTAYVIEGKFSAERLKPVPFKRGILDRFLMRQRYAEPMRAAMGQTELTEIPCSELEPLKRKFREFLGEEIPKSSSATSVFLSYLDLKIMEIYARTEKSNRSGVENSYIQITFSGCAGMAEVSAELGWHWARLWYSKCKISVDQGYFAPFGFIPNEVQPSIPERKFLPVCDFGYAAWKSGQFYLDASAYESVDGEQTIDYLNKTFSTLVSDGKCRCQLCYPDFEAVKIHV